MPFRKWQVQPVFLARTPVAPDKKSIDFEFETVVNGCLVRCLHQLQSVAKIADQVFAEIGSECRLMQQRTEKIQEKLQDLQQHVDKQNARAVHVPCADLDSTSKFLRRNQPYKTVYHLTTQLFLPSNRPQCIDKLYNDASATPVSLMCTMDQYRTDSCSSSQLFMVTPVLGGVRRKRRKMLDIETRKPASFSLAKVDQENKSGVSLGPYTLPMRATRESKSLDYLPSPEEQALAMSLEYPSSVIPVDVSGSSFSRMASCRRSLIHVDFVIKRKKGKHRSKRRHTVCEGDSKHIEAALKDIEMVNSSCQTDDVPEQTSFFSFRSFRRKNRDITRRETVALEGLNFDYITSEKKVPSEQNLSSKKGTLKKSGKNFLMSKAANFKPISTISAALSMAVKMRNKAGKQDDGRSSSGNWSASSSTRASVDSDQHHLVVPIDRASNVSRCSAGKDSVISDSTQHESNRYQESSCGQTQISRALSSTKRSLKNNQAWPYDHEKGRESNNSTPERSSDCASTPLLLSPASHRKRIGTAYHTTALDDGESSVYSVDTDGYYTSMHTDSGLSNNFLGNFKIMEGLTMDSIQCRRRQESQSSVSTIGNSSINSFLSRTVTENSSSNNSLKGENPPPQPPPRVSSSKSPETPKRDTITKQINELEAFEKDLSPTKNCSASESDYEVGDRIRKKTTINSSRYPSMCAVSPETSDDEMSDMRNTIKAPTINVVVAEVHQTESPSSEANPRFSTAPDNKLFQGSASSQNTSEAKRQTQAINMYGSQSPSESTFSSGLFSNQTLTSTPKKPPSVTSFTSDNDDIYLGNTNRNASPAPSSKQADSGKELKVTQSPISPDYARQRGNESLIPLKYAQCITVTPIMKSESSRSNTPPIHTSTEPPARSRSFLRKPLNSFPFLQTDNSSSKSSSTSPSYVSFQSPDSPVSSSTSLSPQLSPVKPTARNVAHVTLDPMGRVIYSSSSLERTTKEGQKPDSVSNDKPRSPLNKEKFNYQTKNSELKLNKPPPSPVVDHPRNCTESKNIAIPDRNTSSYGSLCTTPKFQSLVDRSKQSERELDEEMTVPKMQNLLFRPSRGGRFCRTYFPSHLISLNPNSPRTSTAATVSNFGSNQATKSSPLLNRYQLYAHRGPQDSAVQNKMQCDSQPRQNSPVSTCTTKPSYARSTNAGTYLTYASMVPDKIKQPSSLQTNTLSESTYYPKSYALLHSAKEIPNSSSNVSLLPSSHPRYSFLKRDNTPKTDFLKCINAIKDCKKDAFLVPQEVEKLSQEVNGNTTILTDLFRSNPPDVVPSSSTPPSTLDITSRVNSKQRLDQKTAQTPTTSPSPRKELQSPSNPNSLKSLSPSELFAIIHNSKKKHNIKSDTEKSLSPLSSRSSSPGLGSSPIKAQRVETGVLARQDKPLEGNLNSSSDMMSKTETANDRLGPVKPTSMHDFKMLLSQTRLGGGESNSRPSAAELLKVSPPRNSNTLPTDSNLRSTNRTPPPKTIHAQSQGYLLGHSTVPLKRTIRTRSPYLTRYDSAYPPIWEDLSEETEAADENQNQKCFLPSENHDNRLFTKTENLLNNNNNQTPKATSTWV